MAVNTTNNRIAYVGNGVTQAFAYDFKILEDSHMLVYLNGVLQMSGYVVTGVLDPAGGSVVFSTAPANGVSVVLLREVPETQPVATVDNATILSSVFDLALDRLTMLVQQVSARTTRALRISPVDDATTNLELPVKAARANKYLLFDANGAPSVIDSQIDTRYYGPLAADPATRPDGSPRQAGDLYYNTGTQQFRGFTGVSWNPALPNASLTLTNYTETAATAKTVFTIPGGYTVGAVFPYLNGVLLFPNEFTASNGTTVVLAAPCAIGDEFRCVSYNNFSVADTLSRSSNLNDVPDKALALSTLGGQPAGPTLTSLESLSLANGDLIRATGPDALAPLVPGANGQALRIAAGAPAYGGLGYIWLPEQATTSGSTFDFTGIPAWATEVIVVLDRVRQTAGSIGVLARVAGAPVSTGYVACAGVIDGTTPAAAGSSTNFPFFASTAAVGLCVSLTLVKRPGLDTWHGVVGGFRFGAADGIATGGGRVALAGPLDGIRLLMTGGTGNQGSVVVGYR